MEVRDGCVRVDPQQLCMGKKKRERTHAFLVPLSSTRLCATIDSQSVARHTHIHNSTYLSPCFRCCSAFVAHFVAGWSAEE